MSQDSTIRFACPWGNDQLRAPASTGGEEAPCRGCTSCCLLREHAPRVYAVARRLLSNDGDAADVTRYVLLRAADQLNAFRDEAALAAWLYRVTANATIALRRKRACLRGRGPGDPGLCPG